MAGQRSAKFDWSWTKVSVLGSQVFGQALIENYGLLLPFYELMKLGILAKLTIKWP